MGFQLRIEDGSYVQTLEVRTGALTVGRNPPKGLALTSPGLSARHAIFRQIGERVEMEALATKVGVRMGGERVDRALLAAGESVQVGWARITVAGITPEAPAPDVAAPAASAADAPPPLSFGDEPAPPAQPLPRLAFDDAAAASTAVSPPVAPPAVRRPMTAPAMDHATFEPSAHAARHAARHHAEPAADFVVLSRQAVRVLPWWGISIALHGIFFAIVLLLPKPPKTADELPDSTFSVTLRTAPPQIDPDVPPVELTRRAVDLQRPDMAVPMETPNSTLPASANPKGQEGTSRTRIDEIVPDDQGGGNPWAQPAGSSAIGVGSGARFGSGVGTNMDEAFGQGDAGRANAAAAGKLNGDPFTRALVNGLRLRTTEQNVKVVDGDYDHGELVMTALGLRHGALTADDIAKSEIGQDVRAIFYNCTGRAVNDQRTLTNLERWVSEGGYLFTSDWQVENIIEKAFPGYLKVMRNGTRDVMTPNETITFTIAPGNHPLLAGLPPEAETSRWWLEESSILFTVEKPEAVEVLAVSEDLNRKHGSKFVAVTFKYGKGRVVHALGHMYQKEGNLRGAYAMQRLLLNFLYQAIKNQ